MVDLPAIHMIHVSFRGGVVLGKRIPIPSMYGIFTYIYHILPLKTTKCRLIYHTWIVRDFQCQATMRVTMLSINAAKMRTLSNCFRTLENTQHATTFTWLTLQGINISHLGKRKIMFKMPFLGDMLVSWRVNTLKKTDAATCPYISGTNPGWFTRILVFISLFQSQGLYLVVKLLEKHHCELCWVHMMLRCCTDLCLSSCIYMTLTGKIVTPAVLICTSTSIMQFCMASVHSVSYVLVHFTLQDWRFRILSNLSFGGRSLLNSSWVYGYSICSMLCFPQCCTLLNFK